MRIRAWHDEVGFVSLCCPAAPPCVTVSPVPQPESPQCHRGVTRDRCSRSLRNSGSTTGPSRTLSLPNLTWQTPELGLFAPPGTFPMGAAPVLASGHTWSSAETGGNSLRFTRRGLSIRENLFPERMVKRWSALQGQCGVTWKGSKMSGRGIWGLAALG